MIRSVVAVLIGYAVYSVTNDFGNEVLSLLIPGQLEASGRPATNAAWALSLAYSCICCSFGCYIVALCAARWPMRHALALGFIGFAITAGATPFVWERFPAWYNVASVLAVLPTAWLGGRIRELQIASRSAPGGVALRPASQG